MYDLWRPRLARLAALTAGGVRQVLLAGPALALGIVSLLAVPLGVVAAGFGLAWVAVPLTERLTDLQRRSAGDVLGERIRAGYADTTRTGPVTRPLRWLRDPARWHDVGYLFVAATVGMVLSLLPLVMVGAGITYVVLAGVLGGFWWVMAASVGVPLWVLWWMYTPTLIRARALLDRPLLASRVAELQERVEAVTESRSEAIDLSSAEIRRIERDLHDGAQARIAAVGMTIGLAEQLVERDPAAAAGLLREARETTVSALEDLRSVVRGMHPPVLADRGLAGAVEALTVPLPIPVTLTWRVPDALPLPVESAAYFAVAECVANTVKHSGARRAWVTGAFEAQVLRLVVGDDGRGGADPAGSGLAGIARRLGAFDGTLMVDSPAGGPTVVTMELRC